MLSDKKPSDEKSGRTHGGARSGSGRKPGSGAFGEATIVRRIPRSAAPAVDAWLAALKQRTLDEPAGTGAPDPQSTRWTIPVFTQGVQAGFPSPAEDDISAHIDLNTHLIDHPAATIVLRARGDSMVDAGIGEGDLLIVDRSMTATAGSIIIAAIDNAFTVKILRKTPQGGIELHPANARAGYPVIRPAPDEEIRLIGVVRWIIKQA